MTVQEKIKKRRLELGLTLEQVGEKVGVGKSTVRKWETGKIKNMGRDKVALLSIALKMSPIDLIDEDNDFDSILIGDELASVPGRMKYLRESKGVTLEELSSAIGIDPEIILEYEKGHRPVELEAFARYCFYFKVSADWLLGSISWLNS
jgi:transcriptional regulator with XRE-family HTH domain